VNGDLTVYSDAHALAAAVAERLVSRLSAAQRERGTATVVLTGGRIATAMYRLVSSTPGADEVDWSRVDFWWGDERFVPADDAERNETDAREALLAGLPIDPTRVHPMPSSDSTGDPDAAAAAYATQLAAAAALSGSGAASVLSRADAVPAWSDFGGALPRLDVVLLSVGEDGHVASLFPGRPAGSTTHSVMAVTDSPKPPPVRLTLTLSAINSAEAVWLIASGAEKADAVHAALTGGDVPAAHAHGLVETVWLVDEAAAAAVPPELR
jgi:6-phosphogluconolactonase